MKTDYAFSTAARDYLAAHTTQHGEHDLLGALRSYAQILALHPDAREAGYARTQMLAIVQQVVPPEELLTAQIELALRHLQGGATEGASKPPAEIQ